VSVTVVLNPRSRANRQDPGMGERLASALGGEGEVVAAESLERLAHLTARMADQPPSAIAIHGGDGTLHKSLTALIRAWRDRPLPPIAVLPGGTMNVVASSLGIGGRPEGIVAELAAIVRAGRPLPTLDRRCMKVGEVYGFVFGNGLMANFLEEYYSGASDYGPGRALWLLARTFSSALVDGPYAQKVFRRFEGRVLVDGSELPWRRLTGVGAATVREVGLGFKLNHRADEDPDRFSVLAIHSGPLSLSLDLVPVHQGKGVAPERAFSAVASRLDIHPDASGEHIYTVDGDLYRGTGPIQVSVGPPVHFFRPTQ
jgi:diacylglycerol kinase family enzyme